MTLFIGLCLFAYLLNKYIERRIKKATVPAYKMEPRKDISEIVNKGATLENFEILDSIQRQKKCPEGRDMVLIRKPMKQKVDVLYVSRDGTLYEIDENGEIKEQ